LIHQLHNEINSINIYYWKRVKEHIPSVIPIKIS